MVSKYAANEVIINLELYKRVRFFQMMDPDSKNIYGWNVYRLSLIVVIVIFQFLVAYGISGYFVQMDDSQKIEDTCLVIICTVFYYICMWKVVVCFYYAKKVWDLFEVTRIGFFTSKEICKYVDILYNHRNTIIKISNVGFVVIIVMCMQWIAIPITINLFAADYNSDERMQNIVNYRFPVTVDTYNEHYAIFSAAETTLGVLLLYCSFLGDMFLLCSGWSVIAQYEVLTRAFESFESSEHRRFNTRQQLDIDEDFTNNYKDFKSILFDQRQLHMKLQLFYSIVRPIILVYVALISGLLVAEIYLFLLIYLTSVEWISMFNVFKIGSGILFLFFNLFLYCYLFDSINSKKNSVNFAIYSSKWMTRDFKFKKLMVIAMQINNIDRLKLKMTPKKIIDLHLFCDVVMMSYNIASIILKITEKGE